MRTPPLYCVTLTGGTGSGSTCVRAATKAAAILEARHQLRFCGYDRLVSCVRVSAAPKFDSREEHLASHRYVKRACKPLGSFLTPGPIPKRRTRRRPEARSK